MTGDMPVNRAPKGVRLGVDVGTVRVGVAISDPHGVLATPVTTLARNAAGGTDLVALAALVTEYEVVEVVVGLPKTLRGTGRLRRREIDHRLGGSSVVRGGVTWSGPP
jgi:putative transcription antitermination factor YqgF